MGRYADGGGGVVGKFEFVVGKKDERLDDKKGKTRLGNRLEKGEGTVGAVGQIGEGLLVAEAGQALGKVDDVPVVDVEDAYEGTLLATQTNRLELDLRRWYPRLFLLK